LHNFHLKNKNREVDFYTKKNESYGQSAADKKSTLVAAVRYYSASKLSTNLQRGIHFHPLPVSN
jgi:hypothetical protein